MTTDRSIKWKTAKIEMNASTENILGRATQLLKEGSFKKAAECCKEAIRATPHSHAAYNLLGFAALGQKRFGQASEIFRKALSLDPANDQYGRNLAVAYRNNGKIDDALSAAMEAVKMNPNSPVGYNLLSDLFNRKGDLAQSSKCLQKSFSLHPDPQTALFLGNIFMETGNANQGIACFEKAIQLNPRFLPAYVSVAGALSSRGQFEAAIKFCLKAESLGLESKELYCNHAVARMAIQHVREGIDYNLKALALDPEYAVSIVNMADYAAHSCDWELVEKYEQKALEITMASIGNPERRPRIQPFTALRMDISPAIQRQITELYVNRKYTIGAYSGPEIDDLSNRKIRVGYLSSDFRNHPVFHLAKNLFKYHDHDRFETIAFSIGPDDESEYRKHVETTCDEFVDLEKAGDREAIETLKAAKLDILVDMNGVTSMNRFALVAARPAPIQIHFLGFPGTVGASCIDYFVTDRYLTPAGSESHFAEKLIFMPDTYQISDDESVPEETNLNRADEGLPEDGFVFCSFNSNYKIDRPVFECWARVLKRVPNSVLWLLERPAIAIDSLLKAAEALGIESRRIIVAKKRNKPAHLARHRLADLFLDTHVVCGHTTANDALQMGLPVIAYPGETFISRVSSDLLTAHDLSELICDSYQAYEDLAVNLASDSKRLGELTNKLRTEGSKVPARDTRRFVRHLELAYEIALKRKIQGDHPAHIDVLHEKQLQTATIG